jgi:ubiquitin-like protein Pup
MTQQKQLTKATSTDAEVSEEAEGVSPERQAEIDALKAETDDMLDEIDSVLEQNAQEFVEQYVQKGGE